MSNLFHKRYRWSALLLLLFLALSPSVWADPAAIKFTPTTRVMAFSPDTGHWVLAKYRQLHARNELLFNNQLCRVVDSETAQIVPGVTSSSLFDADRSLDKISRSPGPQDIVQVLDKNGLPVGHWPLSTVQAGRDVRFEGRVYSITSDRTIAATRIEDPAAIGSLQHIEITRSSWQHISDEHTVSGSKNTGKSVFASGVDIQALIRLAELATPVLESNGRLCRVFDAGRTIGGEGQRQTSTYKVISTQTGKLVTAYPIVQ